MSNEFKIPDNPTPAELNQSLIACANNMARLASKVAEYKTNQAYKQTAYKRAYARAYVLYSGAKNATLAKAQAESDKEVCKAQDDLDAATAIYTIAQAEYEAYDNQFTAVRKIANIKVCEINNRLGE